MMINKIENVNMLLELRIGLYGKIMARKKIDLKKNEKVVVKIFVHSKNIGWETLVV